MVSLGAGSLDYAQNWPTKPIKLISVFPAGGSVDQVARVIAQQLTEQTGQPVIVENKGGASGSLGTAALAKADPDSYTIGVVFDTPAVNPYAGSNRGNDDYESQCGTRQNTKNSSQRDHQHHLSDERADPANGPPQPKHVGTSARR